MAVDPIKLLGLGTIRAALAKRGREALPILKATLREHSLLMFRESQRQTPHATGVLRSSGVLQPPKEEGTKVSVTMGYGGAAAKYALRQHEDLSLRHPDPNNPHSDPAGKPKYLEDPVRKGIPALREDLVKRLREAK